MDEIFFDVPSNNVEQQPIQFWSTNNPCQIQTEDKVIGGPNIKTYSQTKPRLKYTNKLLKELKEIGVDLSKEDEDVPVNMNNLSLFDDVDLESIASATQAALSERMDSVDQILENWDPMKTSYEQKSFNNYHEQPYDAIFDEKHNPVNGPNGMKISPTKVDQNEVKLYISNIPLSLSEEGLQNMFGCIAPCKVKRCRPKYTSTDSTYGFVSYESVRCAEMAIQKYDGFNFGGKYPLQVRLAFSKSAGDRAKERILWSGDYNSDNDWIETQRTQSDPGMISQSSDQDITAISDQLKNVKSSNQSEKIIQSPRLYIQGLKVGTSESELKKLFDEIGPTGNCIIVPPKNNNQITTYGFVSYNTFEEADTAIDRFHNFHFNEKLLSVSYSKETAMSGGTKLNEDESYYESLYSEKDPFEEEAPKPNIHSPLPEEGKGKKDICSYCSTPNPAKKCSRCKTPYCNRQCQSLDWPKHQVTCDLSTTKSSVGSLLKTPTNVTKGHHIDVLLCRENFDADVFLSFAVFSRDLKVSGVVICTTQFHYTKKIISMEKQLRECKDNISKVSLNDVCEGLLVVAKYAEDGIGRGVILPFCMDPSKLHYNSIIDVCFIDYGLTRQVKIEDLLHLPTEFLALPKQSDCFIMNGFDTIPQTKNEELFIELNEYVSGKNFKVTFKGIKMNEKIVILTEVGSTKSLNDIFLQKIIAKYEMSDDSIMKARNPSCSDAIHGMMLNDLPNTPFPGEPEFQICGTEVVTPQLFYGQLLDEDTILTLRNLTNALKDIYQNEVIPFVPNINEICVAKCTEDNCWYRAVVLNYNEDLTARVFFIDFGNKGDVHTQNLRSIKESFLNYPKLALKFCIHDCETPHDGVWNDEAIAYLRSHIVNCIVQIRCIKQNTDNMTCDVMSNGESLSVHLQSRGWSGRRIMTSQLLKEELSLKENERFVALGVHVTNAAEFYAWIGNLEVVQQQVRLISEYLSKIGDKDSVYVPVVGELCAVFDKGEWYRGDVKEINQDSCSVQLIDYGNMFNKQLSHVNAITNNEICMKPPFAHKLIIQGMSDPNDPNVIDCINFKMGHCTFLQQNHEAITVKWETSNGVDAAVMVKSAVSANQDPNHTIADNASNAINVSSGEKEPHTLKKYYKRDLQTCKVESESVDFIVTQVESPSLFHGQVADSDIIEAVDELAQKIKEYVDAFPTQIDYLPEINEICIGCHENLWYRVLVKSVNKTTASVLLVDYGDIVDIDVASIYPLPEFASTFPIQGVAMKLNNVVPSDGVQWCQDSINKVKELFLTKVTIKCISLNEELLTVDLKNNKNIDLADVLVSNKLAVPATPVAFTKQPPAADVLTKDYMDEIITSETHIGIRKISLKSCGESSDNSFEVQEILSEASRFTMSSLPPPIAIPNECNVMVTHVDSLGQFYAQLCNNDVVQELCQLTVNMFDFCVCSNKDSYLPVVNSLCFGLDNECWYRAFIKGVSTSSATAFFIDYGNERELPFSELRPISKEFLHLPAIAISMKLFQSDQLDDGKETLQLFRSKVLDEICKVKVIKMENKVSVVDLYTDTGENIFETLNKTTSRSDVMNGEKPYLERNGGQQSSDSTERLVSKSEINHLESIMKANYVPLKIKTKDREISESVSESDLKLSEDLAAVEFVVSRFPDGVHPLESVSLKMNVTTLVAQPTELYVTHVESPYMTYAVPAEVNCREEIEKISNKIGDYLSSNRAEPLIFLKSGILCSVKDQEQKWRRGLVTEVSEKDASVFTIDQGTTITLLHSQIQVLPKELKSFPAQVIPLKLSTIKPKGDTSIVWSSDAIDYFRGIIDKEVVRVKQLFMEDVVNCVKMKLSSSNVVVEDVFVSGGYADETVHKISSRSNPGEASRSNPLKSGIDLEAINKLIPLQSVGKKHFQAVVTCVVSPRLFYVQLFNEHTIRKVDEIGETIKLLYENETSTNDEKPGVGELCALKHDDDLWYRAWVVDVRSKVDATFYLVDYGIKCTAVIEKVRPLPVDLVNVLPAQAIPMQLQYVTPNNSEHYSNEAKAWFKERVELKLLCFELRKMQGQIHRVLMFDFNDIDISEQLIHKGFACSIFENPQFAKMRGSSPQKNDYNSRWNPPNSRHEMAREGHLPPHHYERPFRQNYGGYNGYDPYPHSGTMYYLEERPPFMPPLFANDRHFYERSPRYVDRGRSRYHSNYRHRVMPDERPTATNSTSSGSEENDVPSPEKSRPMGRGRMMQEQRDHKSSKFVKHAEPYDDREHVDSAYKSNRGRGNYRSRHGFYNNNYYNGPYFNRSYPTHDNMYEHNSSFRGRVASYRGRGHDHF